MTFDSGKSLFNSKPSQLRRYRAGLARSYSQSGTSRIGQVGDSTGAAAPHTQAFKFSPLMVTKQLLGKSGYVGRGTGLVPCHINYPASEPRITWFNGMQSYHPFSNMVCNWLNVNGVMFSTKVTGETGNMIDIWYADTSQPFDVSIDEGPKQTVYPTGTKCIKRASFPVPDGTHQVIAQSRVAGVSPFVLGFDLRMNVPYGVETYNAAISGAKTDSLADTDWCMVSKTMSSWDPDLVIVTCTTNDAGAGTPIETFKANMQQGLNNLRVKGADILLTTGTPHQTQDFSPYITALYELAELNDLPLLDFHQRWGSWARANEIGLMNDQAHPSINGYIDQGLAIFEALR